MIPSRSCPADRGYRRGAAILLLLVPFFAGATGLVQGHFLPKVMVLSLLSAGAAAMLWSRREVWLPPRSVLLLIGLWLLLSLPADLFSVAPRLSWLATGVVLSGVVLFLFLLNVRRRSLRLLLGGLVAVSLLQFLTLIETPPGWLWPHPARDPEGRWMGTLGNSEFLSTLLGCGIFAALHFARLSGKRRQRLVWFALVALFAVGLVLARNKGALILVGAYGLWHLSGRRTWPWVLLAGAAVTAAFLFPNGMLGRLFLWGTAVQVLVSHPWLGVGAGQLSNHYLEAVQALFSSFPITLDWFGAHTASARDPHNLLLSLGLELGIGGLFIGAAFFLGAARLCRPLHHPLRAGLAFLLIKSLYTVVVSSGTGALLLAVFLAAAFPRRLLRRAAVPRVVGALQLAAALLVVVVTGAWITSDRHLYQGVRSMAFGELDTARRQLRASLDVTPDYGDAWLTLGEVEFLARDRIAMEAALTKAVFYLRDMDTCKKSAHMYFFSRDYPRALPLYSRLLAAYPQHLTSMARIAQIHAATGNHAAAKAMAQRLLRTAPRVPARSDLRNVEVARSLLAE